MNERIGKGLPLGVVINLKVAQVHELQEVLLPLEDLTPCRPGPALAA